MDSISETASSPRLSTVIGVLGSAAALSAARLRLGVSNGGDVSVDSSLLTKSCNERITSCNATLREGLCSIGAPLSGGLGLRVEVMRQ